MRNVFTGYGLDGRRQMDSLKNTWEWLENALSNISEFILGSSHPAQCFRFPQLFILPLGGLLFHIRFFSNTLHIALIMGGCLRITCIHNTPEQMFTASKSLELFCINKLGLCWKYVCVYLLLYCTVLIRVESGASLWEYTLYCIVMLRIKSICKSVTYYCIVLFLVESAASLWAYTHYWYSIEDLIYGEGHHAWSPR